jgi:hypothetical protein
MDDNRFDRLTRKLATTPSRRGVLKLLGGAVVALGATAVIVPSSRAQSSAECVGAEESCTVNEDCCGRLTCGEDGTCGGPSAGCVGAEEACTVDEDCCGRLTCGEDGNCGGPSDEICCDGACAAIACCIGDDDPNARCPEGTSCFEGVCDEIGSGTDGGDTDGVTELPSTGAGPDSDETSAWLLGAAALGGVAAMAAARLRTSRDEAS